MAVHRSRIRPECAKGPPARCISLIFAIPTATNCAHSIGSRLPDLPQITLRRGVVLEPVTEPDRVTLQHFGARQGHRGDRRRYAGIAVAGVEDARRTLRAVDGGADRKADL